jgi:hypothetical protein
MSKKVISRAADNQKDAGPIRYIELAELEKKLEDGIPFAEVEKLEAAWTASSVPVMDHLAYLRAIGALEARKGVLILASVPA